MIFAMIFICDALRCVGFPDDLSPHATRADCLVRLDAMQAAAAAVVPPGVTIAAMCAPLDDIRRVAPGAFPGHQVGVAL